MKKENKQRDVFDELMPILNRQKEGHFRILFPYNMTQLHWLCGEVVILKVGDKYDVKIFAHDPYGAGEMEEQNFDALQHVITERIQRDHIGEKPLIEVERVKSLFKFRQQRMDKSSCGVITLNDLMLRISGKPLGEKKFAVGASKLRLRHRLLVNQHFKNLPFFSMNGQDF